MAIVIHIYYNLEIDIVSNKAEPPPFLHCIYQLLVEMPPPPPLASALLAEQNEIL